MAQSWAWRWIGLLAPRKTGISYWKFWALMGFASGPLNPLVFTVVQERAPKEMLGRVIGALFALAMAGTSLGRASVGYLLESKTLSPILLVTATVYLLVTLNVLFSPSFRQIDVPDRNA